MSTEELLLRIKKLEERNNELEQNLSFLKSKENASVDILLNSIPGFAFIKDKNLNYVGANRTFCDLLKIPYDEIEGKTDYDIFPKDLAEKYIKDDKKVLKTGKPLFVEEITVDANNPGSRFIVATRKLPWIDNEGNIVGLYGLGFDLSGLSYIEELNKANEIAEESELTFRKLFEDSSDAILLIDKSGVFVECNQAALDLLKMTREEFIYQPPVNISPEFQPYGRKSEDAALEMIELAYKNGLHRFDWTCVNSKGGEFIVEVSLMPISVKGQTMLHTTWRDITKRKRVELELVKAKEKAEESEILKNKLIANIGDVVVIIDQEGNNRYKSPNVKKLFGWKPEELIGKSTFENVHPDDIEQTRVFMDHLVNEPNTKGDIEIRYRHKNGNYSWIKFTGSNLLHDPIINGILGNYHEISERKNAEIELLKAQERANKYTEMVLSSQSVANICSYSTNLIEKDLDKSAWECSPELYKIFGIDETYPHTIAGWAGFIHPDFREELVAYHETVVKTRTSFNKEYKIIRINDGAERWVKGTGELVYDEHGNPVRMHGAIQDVTDFKNAENELIKAKEKAEENEEKLIEAQKLSHVGSWEYYIDTDLVLWSKELYNIFERSYNLPAPNYSEQQTLYTEESFMKLDKAVQDCIQKEIPYEIELDIITSSGAIKQIISKGHVKKDEQGEIIGSYGTAQDITVQKKLERELIKAKEKAEEANLLKTQFLNNMSHEIRTPMNGIIGFSEMLDEPDISEEKRKYFAKIVQNSSHQLLRIIDDILEISTLETKQERLNETEFCLNDLLMELFSIFNLKSKERNIPLYVKKKLNDIQSVIITDKVKLNKIISNLIENALKFTSEGFIEIGYRLSGENLILYVKDTGIGIAPENHTLIFERFSQEEKDISLKHGGLGLGLSICKENAQLLGGDITLESEKYNGSTFYVTIPYKPAKIINDNESESNNGIKRSTVDKYTILIAEDEEVNTLYLETLFENNPKQKYNLIHAKNGKEAVGICEVNNTIDLVLMDIKMPIMNGHEATEKIKEKFPNLPIIAQTAYSTELDKQLALKHGCDEFISKPIDKGKLFELIYKYLIVR